MISKTLTLILILFSFFSHPAFCESGLNAVIKIHTNSLEKSCYAPWSGGSVTSSSGTGFVIAGGLIVTNAHVAADCTVLWLKRVDRAKTYPAAVQFISHGCDLALLRSNDAEFYQDLELLEIGDMPELNETVTVAGYPSGGEKLCFTEGIISRLEYRRYAHDGYETNFAFQTDAAINPGNSGGPVLHKGKICGVAFQGIGSLQSTGYFIPVSVLKHFMQDTDDGACDGFPDLLIDTEQLQSPAHRLFLGCTQESGVLVCRVSKYSPVKNLIRPGDILTAIDGTSIGIDGKFDSRWGRIDYNHLLKKHQISEEIELSILRERRSLKFNAKLGKPFPGMQKSRIYDKYFQYVCVGGCIFQPLCLDYVESWGDNWREDADCALRYYYEEMEYTLPEHRDIVFLSRILPLEFNMEFVDRTCYNIVKSLNNEPVLSFEDFDRRVRELSASERFLVITFLDPEIEPLLIPTAGLDDANAQAREIYRMHGTKVAQ
ncbi:MAG: trypsin-like peptidase domain-containing protein [Candidatus Wallbacteria bacterium]|nr:trypsin-like peptidase domain-containing protein [Candidatus Wallbacteria bacterium]